MTHQPVVTQFGAEKRQKWYKRTGSGSRRCVEPAKTGLVGGGTPISARKLKLPKRRLTSRAPVTADSTNANTGRSAEPDWGWRRPGFRSHARGACTGTRPTSWRGTTPTLRLTAPRSSARTRASRGRSDVRASSGESARKTWMRFSDSTASNTCGPPSKKPRVPSEIFRKPSVNPPVNHSVNPTLRGFKARRDGGLRPLELRSVNHFGEKRVGRARALADARGCARTLARTHEETWFTGFTGFKAPSFRKKMVYGRVYGGFTRVYGPGAPPVNLPSNSDRRQEVIDWE